MSNSEQSQSDKKERHDPDEVIALLNDPDSVGRALPLCIAAECIEQLQLELADANSDINRFMSRLGQEPRSAERSAIPHPLSEEVKAHLWRSYQQGQISADHTARQVFYETLDCLTSWIKERCAPSSGLPINLDALADDQLGFLIGQAIATRDQRRGERSHERANEHLEGDHPDRLSLRDVAARADDWSIEYDGRLYARVENKKWERTPLLLRDLVELAIESRSAKLDNDA